MPQRERALRMDGRVRTGTCRMPVVLTPHSSRVPPLAFNVECGCAVMSADEATEQMMRAPTVCRALRSPKDRQVPVRALASHSGVSRARLNGVMVQYRSVSRLFLCGLGELCERSFQRIGQRWALVFTNCVPDTISTSMWARSKTTLACRPELIWLPTRSSARTSRLAVSRVFARAACLV